MGKALARKVKGMSWGAKVTLVLICTLLTSIFMYQGWYRPDGAAATISTLQNWTTVNDTVVASTSSSSNTTVTAASSFTPQVGTANRVMLVAFTLSNSSTSVTLSNVAVTFGGVAVTKIVDTSALSGRSHVYLGYIPNASIPASGTAQVVFRTSSSTTSTTVRIFCATYDGIDQTAPVRSSASNVASSTSQVAFSGLTVGANDQALFVSAANFNGLTISSVNNANYSYGSRVNGGNTQSVEFWKRSQPASATTDGPTITWSSSSYRLGVAAVSLKAYVDLSGATSLGEGAAVSAASVCPGSTNKLDGFSFVTGSAGGDSITGLTVTSTGTAQIASMSIWDEAGTTQYFSTLNAPTGANIWSFSGGTPIPVGTSAANYKVMVSYVATSPASNTATTANVTSFTGSLPQVGSDIADATLTVRGSAAAAWNTPSSATIRWTLGISGDSALVVRYADTSDSTMPANGTTYTAGTAFGTGTVVYAGTSTSATDAVPAAGTYYYRVFEYNACGTYAASAPYSPAYNYATIASAAPAALAVNTTSDVIINGNNFLTGATVSFNSGVTVNSTTILSNTQIKVNVTPTSTGAKTVYVTNTGSPRSSSVSGALTVDALPTVTSLSPASAPLGGSADITINGTGFLPGATSSFSGAGITVTGTDYVSATKLTAHVSVDPSATRTLRNVTVNNSDGGAASLSGALSISEPLFTIPGAVSFPTVSNNSITIQVAYDADSDNDGTCVIKWGTDNASYPNSAVVTKKTGYFTATVGGLTGGSDGAGKPYYFSATFSDPDGVSGPATVLAVQSTKGSQLMHNSLNLGSTKWPQGWGVAEGKYGAFTCSTCHSRSTINAKLITNVLRSPSLENWSSAGDRNTLQVAYQKALGQDGAHTASTNICEACHSRTQHHTYNQQGPNHQGNVDCTGCHSHNFGFALDSVGGMDCAICHSALNGGSYHHDLSNPAACLKCHADHNVFRSDLNLTNNIGRGANLKVDAAVTAVAGAPGTTYSNTDFIATATNGGICVSCHMIPQTKADTTQTPVIVKADFAGAAHNYIATSTYKRDASTFQANCAKCHTDDAAKKAQAVGNQFSTHGSSVTDILAPLGDTTPTAGGICFRCHSKTTDPVDGTGKATAGMDYYGAATMASDSEGIFGVFQKTGSVHNQISCTDCHNTHAAKKGGHTVGTNVAAPAVNGASGMKPASFPAFWSAPSAGNFTAVNSIVAGTDLEAYLCLKCHSAASGGSLPTSPSGGFTMTDVMKEFNPNNKGAYNGGTYVAQQTAGGFHPVFATAGNNLGAIKLANLVTTNFPWSKTARNLMACSDCHGSDSTADPTGPHGSAAKFLLRGPNTKWDATVTTTSGAMPAGTFCANCHDPSFANSRFSSHTSHHNVACFNCHAAIPHGGPRPGMLVSPKGVTTTNVPAQMADWDLNGSVYAQPPSWSSNLNYILSYPSNNTTGWSSNNCGCNGTGGM